jgi:cysteine desulfurase
MNAEIAVNDARECMAKYISATPREIIFTSCGTEANNMAIISAIHRKNRGNRIITTAIEHPSVLETAKNLEKFGFEVISVKPKIFKQKDGTYQNVVYMQKYI